MKDPLPEDLIVDVIAIELAARGIRDVALTPIERQLADILRQVQADDEGVAL